MKNKIAINNCTRKVCELIQSWAAQRKVPIRAKAFNNFFGLTDTIIVWDGTEISKIDRNDLDSTKYKLVDTESFIHNIHNELKERNSK